MQTSHPGDSGEAAATPSQPACDAWPARGGAAGLGGAAGSVWVCGGGWVIGQKVPRRTGSSLIPVRHSVAAANTGKAAGGVGRHRRVSDCPIASSCQCQGDGPNVARCMRCAPAAPYRRRRPDSRARSPHTTRANVFVRLHAAAATRTARRIATAQATATNSCPTARTSLTSASASTKVLRGLIKQGRIASRPPTRVDEVTVCPRARTPRRIASLSASILASSFQPTGL